VARPVCDPKVVAVRGLSAALDWKAADLKAVAHRALAAKIAVLPVVQAVPKSSDNDLLARPIFADLKVVAMRVAPTADAGIVAASRVRKVREAGIAVDLQARRIVAGMSINASRAARKVAGPNVADMPVRRAPLGVDAIDLLVRPIANSSNETATPAVRKFAVQNAIDLPVRRINIASTRVGRPTALAIMKVAPVSFLAQVDHDSLIAVSMAKANASDAAPTVRPPAIEVEMVRAWVIEVSAGSMAHHRAIAMKAAAV
jgi:hypothetical protein